MQRSVIVDIIAIGSILALLYFYHVHNCIFSQPAIQPTPQHLVQLGPTPIPQPEEPLTYGTWISTFKAANPLFQEFCVQSLLSGQAGSQNGQDMWLFQNIFKTYTLQGRKGFYVDSGANHWKDLSNTLFYDVCLGWDGLCVEPSAEYHSGIQQHRSCKLVTECIADTTKFMHLSGSGVGGSTQEGNDMKCASLETMLLSAPRGPRTHVDFWSLDVEGYEITVLSGVNFHKISVSVLLVEDFWISQRRLDEVLLNSEHTNLVKAKQFPIDSLFIKKDLELPSPLWYPPGWSSFVEINKGFRAQMMQENKLRCE